MVIEDHQPAETSSEPRLDENVFHDDDLP